MFDQPLNSLVNAIDGAIPVWLKRRIKQASPGIADRIYTGLARMTSDEPREVRVQSGTLAGRPFLCSLKHQRSCYLGNFEPWKAEILATYLGPGKVYFDVGGHIGYFSLMAAAHVAPLGSVIAFEPDAKNAAQFGENLRLNPDLETLIQLNEMAVADVVGQSRFERGGNSYIGHLAPVGTASGVRVDTITLDAVSESTDLLPDFVKIDAEGAEALIFDGMRKILERSRPVLLVEIHDPASYKAYQELLGRYSYESRTVDGPDGSRTGSGWNEPSEYLAIPR